MEEENEGISMQEPKEKLRKLRELLPNVPNPMIYALGEYLADYLNDELVPMGFLMGCHLALYDLSRNQDGFTGKPINNSLTGYPPQIYSLLRLDIPRIADAVFPTDFAEEAKKLYEEASKAALKKD